MVNMVIAGEAGQGIESAQDMLGKILHYKKFHTFTLSEYMSRVRGGSNSALIKVTSNSSPYFEERIDYLFVLDEKVREHLKKRITAKTHFIDAQKSNIYAVGFIVSLFRIDPNESIEVLKKDYEKIFKIEKNQQDFFRGYNDAKNSGINFEISSDEELSGKKIFAGNMSQSLGSIAGGVNFISFYPMSPSTPISINLTQLGDEFNIISEQAEDEIAAINMALGASYAGARSCVATSGGGFALMCECVSLAGITETPIVIHLCQRPGPATGLPTRTAQEDLNLALYSGHGEFERVIYAPSNVYDSFEIGQIAFETSQRYQLPVFILSDQCLLESSYAVDPCIPMENHNYYVASSADYKRYQLSENPISPLSVPSYGEGFVCVDSDEHDELGWITEDMDVRTKMTEKRLKKGELLKREILAPYFVNKGEYEWLFISWGSTYELLKAVVEKQNGYALLHYRQLHPLSGEILRYFKDKKLILVEQNATGQFGKLITQEFGIECDYKLLKYDGMPLSIEDIERFLNEIR